jgi:hypothetical protein
VHYGDDPAVGLSGGAGAGVHTQSPEELHVQVSDCEGICVGAVQNNNIVSL